MADVARCVGTTDEDIIAVLAAPGRDPRLPDVVATLYRRWTPIAVGNYISLPPGARETAFAVTLEQLAREVRRARKPLRGDTLRQREHEVLLKHLSSRSRVESRYRPNERWLPTSAVHRDGALGLIAVLVRCSNGNGDAAAQLLVTELHAALLVRARAAFRRLRMPERRTAISRTVERLTRPLTAASLTPDNLSRRVRDVAVQELSELLKRQWRESEKHRADKCTDPPDDRSEGAEEIHTRQWFARAGAIFGPPSSEPLHGPKAGSTGR